MRGKADISAAGDVTGGITPAYAGKSVVFSFCLLLAQDHPRLCGEKQLFSVLLSYHKGSPPPMRGKATIRPTGFKLMRITPAYAGKSTWKYMPFVTSQDHPRLCGEKLAVTVWKPVM